MTMAPVNQDKVELNVEEVERLIAMNPNDFTDPFWAYQYQRDLRVYKALSGADYDWQKQEAITERGDEEAETIEHLVWQLRALTHGTKEQAYDHNDY